MKKASTLFKIIAIVVASSICWTAIMPASYAQIVSTPAPLLLPTPAAQTTLLKGLKIDPNNPFRFDFVISHPPSAISYQQEQKSGELEAESYKLIKYFLASLAIPESDLWVNLSPYEEDRIIPQDFGATEMGRDMLAQDYLLKQFTSSLLHPDNEYGKKFWERIYAQAFEKYGTTDIPIDTFHKIWIKPSVAEVYEGDGVAYVTESKLKVMLEEDYFASKQYEVNSKKQAMLTRGHSTSEQNSQRGSVSPSRLPSNLGLSMKATQGSTAGHTMTTQLMRDIIIPAIQKEVNHGAYFAQLRQIFHSLILATWYKRKLKTSVLNQVYADQHKTVGVDHGDQEAAQKIWSNYVSSFQEGVFNFIREERDVIPSAVEGSQITNGDSSMGRSSSDDIIPRKYFSGGVEFQIPLTTTSYISPLQLNDPDAAMVSVELEAVTDQAMSADVDEDNKVWKFLDHLSKQEAVAVANALKPRILNFIRILNEKNISLKFDDIVKMNGDQFIEIITASFKNSPFEDVVGGTVFVRRLRQLLKKTDLNWRWDYLVEEAIHPRAFQKSFKKEMLKKVHAYEFFIREFLKKYIVASEQENIPELIKKHLSSIEKEEEIDFNSVEDVEKFWNELVEAADSPKYKWEKIKAHEKKYLTLSFKQAKILLQVLHPKITKIFEKIIISKMAPEQVMINLQEFSKEERVLLDELVKDFDGTFLEAPTMRQFSSRLIKLIVLGTSNGTIKDYIDLAYSQIKRSEELEEYKVVYQEAKEAFLLFLMRLSVKEIDTNISNVKRFDLEEMDDGKIKETLQFALTAFEGTWLAGETDARRIYRKYAILKRIVNDKSGERYIENLAYERLHGLRMTGNLDSLYDVADQAMTTTYKFTLSRFKEDDALRKRVLKRMQVDWAKDVREYRRKKEVLDQKLNDESDEKKQYRELEFKDPFLYALMNRIRTKFYARIESQLENLTLRIYNGYAFDGFVAIFYLDGKKLWQIAVNENSLIEDNSPESTLQENSEGIDWDVLEENHTQSQLRAFIVLEDSVEYLASLSRSHVGNLTNLPDSTDTLVQPKRVPPKNIAPIPNLVKPSPQVIANVSSQTITNFSDASPKLQETIKRLQREFSGSDHAMAVNKIDVKSLLEEHLEEVKGKTSHAAAKVLGVTPKVLRVYFNEDSKRFEQYGILPVKKYENFSTNPEFLKLGEQLLKIYNGEITDSIRSQFNKFKFITPAFNADGKKFPGLKMRFTNFKVGEQYRVSIKKIDGAFYIVFTGINFGDVKYLSEARLKKAVSSVELSRTSDKGRRDNLSLATLKTFLISLVSNASDVESNAQDFKKDEFIRNFSGEPWRINLNGLSVNIHYVPSGITKVVLNRAQDGYYLRFDNDDGSSVYADIQRITGQKEISKITIYAFDTLAEARKNALISKYKPGLSLNKDQAMAGDGKSASAKLKTSGLHLPKKKGLGTIRFNIKDLTDRLEILAKDKTTPIKKEHIFKIISMIMLKEIKLTGENVNIIEYTKDKKIRKIGSIDSSIAHLFFGPNGKVSRDRENKNFKQPLHLSVAGFIRTQDGKYVVIQKAGRTKYTLVAEHVSDADSLREAMLKGIKEELGLPENHQLKEENLRRISKKGAFDRADVNHNVRRTFFVYDLTKEDERVIKKHQKQLAKTLTKLGERKFDRELTRRQREGDYGHNEVKRIKFIEKEELTQLSPKETSGLLKSALKDKRIQGGVLSEHDQAMAGDEGKEKKKRQWRYVLKLSKKDAQVFAEKMKPKVRELIKKLIEKEISVKSSDLKIEKSQDFVQAVQEVFVGTPFEDTISGAVFIRRWNSVLSKAEYNWRWEQLVEESSGVISNDKNTEKYQARSKISVHELNIRNLIRKLKISNQTEQKLIRSEFKHDEEIYSMTLDQLKEFWNTLVDQADLPEKSWENFEINEGLYIEKKYQAILKDIEPKIIDFIVQALESKISMTSTMFVYRKFSVEERKILAELVKPFDGNFLEIKDVVTFYVKVGQLLKFANSNKKWPDYLKRAYRKIYRSDDLVKYQRIHRRAKGALSAFLMYLSKSGMDIRINAVKKYDLNNIDGDDKKEAVRLALQALEGTWLEGETQGARIVEKLNILKNIVQDKSKWGHLEHQAEELLKKIGLDEGYTDQAMASEDNPEEMENFGKDIGALVQEYEQKGLEGPAIIEINGSPGSGKSSIVDMLEKMFNRFGYEVIRVGDMSKIPTFSHEKTIYVFDEELMEHNRYAAEKFMDDYKGIAIIETVEYAPIHLLDVEPKLKIVLWADQETRRHRVNDDRKMNFRAYEERNPHAVYRTIYNMDKNSLEIKEEYLNRGFDAEVKGNDSAMSVQTAPIKVAEKWSEEKSFELGKQIVNSLGLLPVYNDQWTSLQGTISYDGQEYGTHIRGKSFGDRRTRATLFRLGYLFFLDNKLKSKLSSDLLQQLGNNVIWIEGLSNTPLANFHPDLPHMGQYTSATILTMMKAQLKNTRFIDFGAGEGILSLVAAKLGAAEIIMVDNSEDHLARGKSLLIQNGFSEQHIFTHKEDISKLEELIALFPKTQLKTTIGVNLGVWYPKVSNEQILNGVPMLEQMTTSQVIEVFLGGYTSRHMFDKQNLPHDDHLDQPVLADLNFEHVAYAQVIDSMSVHAKARLEVSLDQAMASDKLGGIDLNMEDVAIGTQGADTIKFNFTPAQIEQMRQNILGFTPVIINIQPHINIPFFLGLVDSADEIYLARVS